MSQKSIAPLTWEEVKAVVQGVLDTTVLSVYQSEAQRTQITSNAVANTYEKIVVPLTAENDSGGKLAYNATTERLEHTGATTTYDFDATATVDESDTVNNVIHFCLHKNGVKVDNAEAYSLIRSASPTPDTGSLNGATTVTLSDGDYVEVWAKSNKAGSTYYCNHLSLKFIEIVGLGI